MSLFPSNQIAERDHGPVFSNLAGVLPEKAKTQAQKELAEAGINSQHWRTEGEVQCNTIGICHGWQFRRCWYYWSAKGPGIPPNYASELHREFGKEVRVEGHCGAPDPVEYCNGFAVGSYHVDTQRGLKALADMIKRIKIDAALGKDGE